MTNMTGPELWRIFERARQTVYGGSIFAWRLLDKDTRRVYIRAARAIRDISCERKEKT